MNMRLISLEIAVVLVGLGVLLADLWAPAAAKRRLGYAAAAALGLIFLFSFTETFGAGSAATAAFKGMYVQDALALFFKRLFLVAAILVLILAVEFSDRIATGIGEYYSITVFALAGMMFAASAADFTLLFVSIELITVSFYVLASFQRDRVISLEAGVKYLILGALSSAFLVFGIALVFGTTGTMTFTGLAEASPGFIPSRVFQLGMLLIFAGLAFKIAAFPFQVWAPDVYQGAPTPTTAFLAVGSKAAGFVLLLRLLFVAVPVVAVEWMKLLIVLSAVTMLYGSLCAIPQRNLKRLMGYSSIANAGYLLMGVAALSQTGQAAILFYLTSYLFAVLTAFAVIALVMRHLDTEDLGELSGLHQRSPLLAGALAVAMVSLAGVPPLAGFFGKFLLLKAVLEKTSTHWAYAWLAGVAVVSVVISLYYYFGVVRAVYWPNAAPFEFAKPREPIQVTGPIKFSIGICVAMTFILGLFPDGLLQAATAAAAVLR